MTFLCDRMLVRVAKWLRAAGYDVAVATPEEDDACLLARARRERRVLLTCDRKLKRELASGDEQVVVLACSQPDAAADELVQRLGIDWLAAPFTRCIEDNTLLRPADAAEATAVPDTALGAGDRLMACPTCARVYWPGSHVRRMKTRLARWRGL